MLLCRDSAERRLSNCLLRNHNRKSHDSLLIRFASTSSVINPKLR